MRQYIESFVMDYGGAEYECRVPCSVYKTLIERGAIPDPYYRENEREATLVCDCGAGFSAEFSLGDDILGSDRLVLVFEGIDTLADVFLNGEKLASTDNMHRRYGFDISRIAKSVNRLDVKIHSPNRYVAEMAEKRPLYGVEHAMAGYQHIRKAHCMFGWDWGPKLPDMGIWRPVYVEGFSGGKINGVYYRQKHSEGTAVLSCSADLDIWGDGISAELTVSEPGGRVFKADITGGSAEIKIDNPRLWWVRGLGEQPLYSCSVTLKKGGEVIAESVRKIGLRTLTVSQDKDEWGEEFCFINNGIKVFAMGANYIPEDQIVTRCTPEKTARLLESCEAANYNFIRVWGGGYYPDESFYDWCDRHGFIVWQDFMFACAAYLLTPEFEATVREEIKDNILRLRNHACLGLWCGNNEIESAFAGWGWNRDPEAKADYLRLFEDIIPKTVAEYDPETFYWPSSPSSGGGFIDPSSNHAGDMHYWAVWHNFKPIEDFDRYHYRFCSEYGFESVPDIKTVRAFAEEGDLDLCGNVMQMHQKCTLGNEKLMFYLAQMVNYPYDFERLVYCSQLVQADCIRSFVEHMRRARGRCMGSAYWQVNDSNPVISWSSIDWYGRWKALHYYAKRFYSPMLISCDISRPESPEIYVTNDTLSDRRLTASCRLRDNTSRVIAEFSADVVSRAMSAEKVLVPDISRYIGTVEERRTRYLEYEISEGGSVLSAGTTLFVRPKEFAILPPKISFTVEEKPDRFELVFTADVYAKSVALSLPDCDAVFSDNWFDIHGSKPVRVSVGKSGVTREEVERTEVRWY